MKKLELILKSILAGICIGIGGLTFLILYEKFILASFLFSIGLFLICTRNYKLFTGSVCYSLENKISYIFDLIIIWIGNFIGCFLCSLIKPVLNENIINTSKLLVSNKLNNSYLNLFILGIICNILIYFAVDGYKKLGNNIGGYLSIILCVGCFIIIGGEHCVADIFYWCISGVLYNIPLESIFRILIITLGNIIGGILIPMINKILSFKYFH